MRKRRQQRFVLLFAFVAFLSACSRAIPSFRGKVVGVSDGDTIKVLVNREEVTVRLEGIDAPEARQSFGNQSKQALSDLIFGREVTVRYTKEDRAGRNVGIVILSNTDINAKMVENGWAWHFVDYGDDPRLAALEGKAKSAKRGLWADPTPLPPWEYRARQKREQGEPATRFWLNLSTNVRHNEKCEFFKKAKNGRLCTASEGRACRICGG
jgi:micrococcal nuclease